MTAQIPNQGTIEASPHEDRRRHARADLKIKARYLDGSGAEHPCIVTNISAGGAMLKARQVPKCGQQIVLYIDNVGRFHGDVIRASESGFVVTYTKGRKRAKAKRTADALTEILNNTGNKADRRGAPRIRQDAPALVILDDGETAACSILDISLTGASIEISPRPALGSQITVGRMQAKVVRRHDAGVGVVFTGPAHKMEEVIDDATKTTSRTGRQPLGGENGAGLATNFGRKS